MGFFKKSMLVLIAALAAIALSDALSCRTCSDVRCERPETCEGGLVKDVCYCCDVCAKVLGEQCGGPFGVKGTCDKGLVCKKEPMEGLDLFNAIGKCVPL